MGFLKRLLSVGGKTKRKDGKNDKSKKNAASSSNTHLIPIPQDQEAVVNRLLRSSSTHFSVLSETEYRTMPPIPHPINNVLRAPSIISSATQTDTYTVTVHRRMLHSRTEFPNANRSGSSSTSNSPTRRHSIPPLTPGDKNRLARLRQDASVLSLLDIYDATGCPDPEAFSNTPARREENDGSLRALLGNPSPPSLTASRTSAEESDISWADRYIRTARRNSTSSNLTTSSLGIPVDLFKGSLSPERLRFDHSGNISSLHDMDVGIDSLQVERGTVEDTSIIFQPPIIGLTNPTRRASQFFKFLSDGESAQALNHPLPALPSAPFPPATSSQLFPPSPRGPCSIHPLTSSTAVGDAGRSSTDIPVLFVRDGPKESHAHISPPPRRRPNPSPLPETPAQHQPQTTKPLKPKQAPLGYRVPFDELRNAEGCDPALAPRTVSARSVSVASSVHPEIETQDPNVGSDPYTPVPQRRTAEGKRERHDAIGENVPPNAPARPVRGQARKHNSRDSSRNTRTKDNSTSQNLTSTKIALTEQSTYISNIPLKDDQLPRLSPKATPAKNPAFSHLRTPPRPSPASSSELSPEGRQIMASIRAKARKSSQGKTPRAWQSWGSTVDPSHDESHA